MISIAMVILTSRIFHSKMLNAILRSSMQFFESVPIGRLINRFSKDMNSIELLVPMSIKDVLFCLSDAISTVVVIAISTPFSLVVLAPISLLYFILQVRNLKKNKNNFKTKVID